MIMISEPRATAYYYADLERIKRKTDEPAQTNLEPQIQTNELSEYVDTEVFNDGGIQEVPPLRDRQRHQSLPEYSTPENRKPGETYSTAGTFPMPEPKEKEPLLAELELVGRLPLTQLETVRRSRSWYLCCPNVGDEELSRDSSWRYSSLRPITAPPHRNLNNAIMMVATQSTGPDDVTALRAERDALARALAAERQRAATAARAHDARLAELHGVIAELVRRRAADKSGAIPEEVSDDCESTTQPAGELPEESTAQDTSSLTPDQSDDRCKVEEASLSSSCACDAREHRLCVDSARCCQRVRESWQRGSAERVFASSPGRCESRQAKIAARVKLRRTEESDSNNHEEAWAGDSAGGAERLALEVCAHAGLREALVAADHDGASLSLAAHAWRARCARLSADARVLQLALARAADTAHRLSCACAVSESSCVSLCAALRAADRALELYDVLLALAETQHGPDHDRSAAEAVARQLLQRLEHEEVSIGEPLMSPGPWLQHQASSEQPSEPWSAASEAQLRSHAARLKAATVSLRALAKPTLFSYHDSETEEVCQSIGNVSLNMADMETAVMMQEVLSAREERAARALRGEADTKEEPPTRRERHWLETQASETDL